MQPQSIYSFAVAVTHNVCTILSLRHVIQYSNTEKLQSKLSYLSNRQAVTACLDTAQETNLRGGFGWYKDVCL